MFVSNDLTWRCGHSKTLSNIRQGKRPQCLLCYRKAKHRWEQSSKGRATLVRIAQRYSRTEKGRLSIARNSKKRVWVGSYYVTASTPAQAAVLREYIKQRLAGFRNSQKDTP